MTHSFVAYIDEAGDEGFEFPQPGINGTSHWFILSAVVIRRSADIETVKLIDAVRHRLNKKSHVTLHFREMNHDQKLVYCDEISRARLRIITVIVHKPSIIKRTVFTSKNTLYFYASRYLLERISWLCHENRVENDNEDGAVKIIFSNRSGLSYEDFRSYLQTLAYISDINNGQIFWDTIKPDRIVSLPHARSMGLQIADAAASSAFKAVEPNSNGFREERYARMLSGVYYRREGRLASYGLKIWPAPATSDAAQACAWTTEI